LAIARMSIFSRKLALALALAALCLGARTAHAQAAPVRYWIPSWPFGFGGNLNVGPNSNTYGNFPGFDGSGGGGFSDTRYNFSDGWFVGGEGGGLGMSMNGINQGGAFGNFSSLYYQGVQFGYNSHTAGGLPLTVYAGFDTLKYDAGSGGPFASFDSMSGTLPVYSVHAGVQFQATSNISLSLGVGYTQQSGYIGSDINSLALPGAVPFAFGGRR
jgi:hypothetical protein